MSKPPCVHDPLPPADLGKAPAHDPPSRVVSHHADNTVHSDKMAKIQALKQELQDAELALTPPRRVKTESGASEDDPFMDLVEDFAKETAAHPMEIEDSP